MTKKLKALKPHDVGGDGDCFFRSVAAAETKNRAEIDRKHLEVRRKICEFIDQKQAATPISNPQFMYIVDGSQGIQSQGQWGEVELCSAVAQIYNRNVIVVYSHRFTDVDPFVCYTPLKKISDGNFESFDKTPIIIYAVPNHFQTMVSKDTNIPTDKILNDVNQILKKRITTGLGLQTTNAMVQEVGVEVDVEVVPAPIEQKKSFWQLLKNIVLFVPNLILTFFKWAFNFSDHGSALVHVDSKRSIKAENNLDFFKVNKFTIICEHENINIDNDNCAVRNDFSPDDNSDTGDQPTIGIISPLREAKETKQGEAKEESQVHTAPYTIPKPKLNIAT